MIDTSAIVCIIDTSLPAQLGQPRRFERRLLRLVSKTRVRSALFHEIVPDKRADSSCTYSPVRSDTCRVTFGMRAMLSAVLSHRTHVEDVEDHQHKRTARSTAETTHLDVNRTFHRADEHLHRTSPIRKGPRK